MTTLTARRSSLPAHDATGAIEPKLAVVRRRLNRTDDVTRWASLIRADLEAGGGKPSHPRRMAVLVAYDTPGEKGVLLAGVAVRPDRGYDRADTARPGERQIRLSWCVVTARGGVDHGEHPVDTVMREFIEEAGLTVRVEGTCTVYSDEVEIPSRRLRLHSVRLCYSVTVVGGDLRDEADGSTDLVRWVDVGEARRLNVMAPFVASAIEHVRRFGAGS